MLIDGKVLILDHRTGLALPDVAEIAKAPDSLKPFTIDPNLPYDVTPERVARSRAYLAVPLSALAPRAKFVQSLQTATGAARLAADPEARLARWQSAYPNRAVQFWNPPVPGTLTRVLVETLAPDEGGRDKAPPGQHRLDRYRLGAVPWAMLPKFLRELPGPVGDRLKIAFAQRVIFTQQPGGPANLLSERRMEEAIKAALREKDDMVANAGSKPKSKKWPGAAPTIAARPCAN